MDHTKTFKSEYLPIFEQVCIFLGEGWRVNLLQQNVEHQIKLTNPTLKNYSIVARLEKNRIIIYGGIDYHYYSYAKLAKCTVSLIRNARSIAQDIKRKILINAVDEINKANDYHQKKQQDEEHRKIVKGMLTRLVKLTPHWNAMTGVKTLSGIDGTIRESYKGYVVQFDGLTTEQLIKLVGFISVL